MPLFRPFNFDQVLEIRPQSPLSTVGSQSQRLSRAMLVVFSFTLVLNAALLFLIQPMIAKMILPWLGGSPAVWNTSLVFYQTCLLAGYGYAHFGSYWLGTRRQALAHLILILGGLLFLPTALPIRWFVGSPVSPIGLVFGVLSVMIGVPFIILAAGTPLVQKWFAYCQHGISRDPYFLYAASNAGSIVGLLVYPFVLEPTLTLSQQSYLWFYGYMILVVLISVCVLYFMRALGTGETPGPQAAEERLMPITRAERIPFARRLRWIVWSFVPSSLLMGVTSYISTDIASMPLLWVVPLSAYLLSFIIAFARPSWATNAFLIRRQAFLLVGAAITVFMHATEPLWIVLPLHLIAFFTTALICHGCLAQDRPDPSNLTDYYFAVSLGGVMGGIFNALIAPLIFKTILEYPLAIAAAAFLRPNIGEKVTTNLHRRLDWLVPPVLIFSMALLAVAIKEHQALTAFNERFLLWASAGVVCMVFAYRPVRFGVSLLALIAVSLWYPSELGNTVYAGRSFFGSYLVTMDPGTKKHLLFQGTTIHGVQSTEQQKRLIPMAYYHRTGPAGQVLLAPLKFQPSGTIAVVGLGGGALACYGTTARKFTFYEIDPLVEKIARSEKLFTYLRDCPAQTEIVIGDARISLAKATDHQFDLFILDAFSSDMIPTHLLTREAVELYLAKTTVNGFLLFHISNRYLDLAPVLERLASNLNLVALIQNDTQVSAQEAEEGKFSSRWVILSRRESSVAPFLADSRWQRIDARSEGDLWTDDFSNTLNLISLSKFTRASIAKIGDLPALRLIKDAFGGETAAGIGR